LKLAEVIELPERGTEQSENSKNETLMRAVKIIVVHKLLYVIMFATKTLKKM
jgi:hypothetical protein